MPSAKRGMYVASGACSSTNPSPTAMPTAIAAMDFTIENELVRVVVACPRK